MPCSYTHYQEYTLDTTFASILIRNFFYLSTIPHKSFMYDWYPRGALLMEIGEHEAAMKLVAMNVLDAGIKRGKEKLILFKL